jgi:ribosomal protein S1
MTAKKLFVLLLSVVFVFGTVGLAAAAQHEKKMDSEKKMEKKPAAAKAKSATGTLKSVSADSLVVDAGKDKKDWTFALTDKKVAEAAMKFKAGDSVTVSFTEADGKMTATRVMAKAAKMEKKAEKKMEKKAENPCAAKK